jgi:hypothetical protein
MLPAAPTTLTAGCSSSSCDRFGGASRARTDDLLVANSETCPTRRDTEEVGVMCRGSVYAGPPHTRCPFLLSE